MKTIIKYIIIKRRQRKYLDKAFHSEKGVFTVNKPEYKSSVTVSRRNDWGETMIMVDDHFIFISQEETDRLIKYLLDK